MPKTPSDHDARIEISGDLDRYGAEELQLEVRRLLKRAGIDVKSIQVVPGGDGERGGSS